MSEEPIVEEPIVELPVPNAMRFDASVSTRISDGKLLAAVSVCMTPCLRDEQGVMSDIEGIAPQIFILGDIEKDAAKHPALAAQVNALWAALKLLASAVAVEKGKTSG